MPASRRVAALAHPSRARVSRAVPDAARAPTRENENISSSRARRASSPRERARERRCTEFARRPREPSRAPTGDPSSTTTRWTRARGNARERETENSRRASRRETRRSDAPVRAETANIVVGRSDVAPRDGRPKKCARGNIHGVKEHQSTMWVVGFSRRATSVSRSRRRPARGVVDTS